MPPARDSHPMDVNRASTDDSQALRLRECYSDAPHLDALETLGLTGGYQVVDQGTLPEADTRRGYPTPTLL